MPDAQPIPVIHLRRPRDAVTIVLEAEPEPSDRAAPFVLVPPFRLRLLGAVLVHTAPDDTAPARRIADGRTVDVFEQRGDWWWVTDPPTPALWMRAAVLAMSGERE